jgi:alcohol dehydrogenase
MVSNFRFASIPNLIFGAGKFSELYDIIANFGKNVLFVIGGSSLKVSGKWDEITSEMLRRTINFYSVSIAGEPTPTLIDEAVKKFRQKNLDLIIGIGGGSVIDAGKAISAMIPKNDSIKNYLEGVGDKVHDGKKIPYIAIPTTSGTGSESTKNAVITEVGPEGFKKSLRHDNLVPNYAIVDPKLVVSCPPSITAACGMDAFTQLLEAYISPRSSPITDALAYSGIKQMKENIISVYSNKSLDINARSAMAYGSLISGIVLANAGLGIVHGLASSIGGLFNIPHGTVCGTLLAESTKMNVKRLEQVGHSGEHELMKYAIVGAIIAGKGYEANIGVSYYCSVLVETLENWTKKLNIERLGKYGITYNDIDNIIERTGLKNNPVKLNLEDIKEIVVNRI